MPHKGYIEPLIYRKDDHTIIVTYEGKDYFFVCNPFLFEMDLTEYFCRSHKTYLVLRHWWRAGWETNSLPGKLYKTAEEAITAAFTKEHE